MQPTPPSTIATVAAGLLSPTVLKPSPLCTNSTNLQPLQLLRITSKPFWRSITAAAGLLSLTHCCIVTMHCNFESVPATITNYWLADHTCRQTTSAHPHCSPTISKTTRKKEWTTTAQGGFSKRQPAAAPEAPPPVTIVTLTCLTRDQHIQQVAEVESLGPQS